LKLALFDMLLALVLVERLDALLFQLAPLDMLLVLLLVELIMQAAIL
jgi:hypothetical protein